MDGADYLFIFMERIKSFKDLRTWQSAQKLSESIYKITSLFPVDERRGLTDQLRRASVSVSSNIAEGKGRGSAKEFIQFLIFARGSTQEIISQLDIAARLGFANYIELDNLIKDYNGLHAGINAHISSLSKYK